MRQFFTAARKNRARHFLSYERAESFQGSGQLRFAALATKKGIGKLAVDRNKARRRLVAAVNAGLQNGSIVTPVDVKIDWVLMANRSVLKCPWPELLEDVVATWKRATAKYDGK